MNRISAIVVVLTAGVALSTGCVTKKSVNAQVEPVMNKVNDLDDRTAQQHRDVLDLDSRTQKGVTDVNGRIDGVEQKNKRAFEDADRAQQLASRTSQGVDALSMRVANYDNYHPVNTASVKFGFDKADLDRRSKAELDELAKQAAGSRNYIIEVEGGTDSVGSSEYNYALSQRRASAVVQYLAANGGVPAHKIYVIGLGKDKPAAENNSRTGRAENRRVDVRLLTNTVDAPADSKAPAQGPATTARN